MSPHKKQKALEKKRLKRRHKNQRRRALSPPPGTRLIHDPPGLEKMSVVLEEFVDPYVHMAPTLEEMRRLYTLATLAWNAALLPPEARAEFIQRGAQALPAEARGDFRAILVPMIERKLAHFADNRRQICGFDLSEGPHGPYLQVMSTMPGG